MTDCLVNGGLSNMLKISKLHDITIIASKVYHCLSDCSLTDQDNRHLENCPCEIATKFQTWISKRLACTLFTRFCAKILKVAAKRPILNQMCPFQIGFLKIAYVIRHLPNCKSIAQSVWPVLLLTHWLTDWLTNWLPH